METWLGRVYLYLPVELYVPVRSVHTCACHSLPPFTVRLGVCIARLRRVRQMVDSWEVCRSNLDAQQELASLIVSLAFQCQLSPVSSVERDLVRLHWRVFDEVAVRSPWASTRREAISLIWRFCGGIYSSAGVEEVIHRLWRQRHRAALLRIGHYRIVRRARAYMQARTHRMAGDLFLGGGFSTGLVEYLMDSDLMDQYESLFPLTQVLYADQAFLCRDVQWFEREHVLTNPAVGQRFQYQGRMREILVADVVGYLMDLTHVSEFCMVFFVSHVSGSL